MNPRWKVRIGTSWRAGGFLTEELRSSTGQCPETEAGQRWGGWVRRKWGMQKGNPLITTII